MNLHLFIVIILTFGLFDCQCLAENNDEMVVRSSSDDEHEPVSISQLADPQLNLHNKRMLIIGSYGYDSPYYCLLKLPKVGITVFCV
jgi:hypothetical protein